MSELPVTLDITLYQGATWRQHLRWKPGGTAQDFTAPAPGWTAAPQVRRRHGQAVVLELTTAGGGITLDSGGNIRLLATAAQTGAIGRGTYRYDLELYAPGGDTFRFVMGTATLSEEITVPEVTP